MQVLVLGKVSQAVVVAGAAYHDEASFQRITGISKSKMVVDKARTGAQVLPTIHPSASCLHGSLMDAHAHTIHVIPSCMRTPGCQHCRIRSVCSACASMRAVL